MGLTSEIYDSVEFGHWVHLPLCSKYMRMQGEGGRRKRRRIEAEAGFETLSQLSPRNTSGVRKTQLKTRDPLQLRPCGTLGVKVYIA